MRQAVHLYGDDGNLIGENIGWVERYDGGKQWKGFTRHGALPFRRSRPDAARDVLRQWRIRSQPAVRPPVTATPPPPAG
jgi:hypothetical protein